MTLSFALKSIVELLIIVLLAYGYYHEDKVIRFERKAARVIRLLIAEYRRDRARKKLTVHSNGDKGNNSGAFVA